MSNKNAEISVILPVYNVESYLNQCLDSIVNQTFQNTEILCIDDSSDDKSPEILNEYKQKDNRIKIHKTPHVGVGAARNIGFNLSKGKYVIFWDSDDWFEPDALQKMYSKAEETDADVCICNATDFDNSTGKTLFHNYIRKPYPEKAAFCIQDCPDRIFQITSSNCWNRLVRKDFLKENDILFPEGDFIEDEAFSMLTLSLAKRITLVNNRLIHYRVNRPGSLMTNYEKRDNPSVKGYWECYKQLEKRGILENAVIRRSFVDRICGLYLYQLNQNKTLERFIINYNNTICDDGLFDKLWDNSCEPTPHVKAYIKARNTTPYEYLFEKFIDLSETNSRRTAEINELKEENKKLRENKKANDKKTEGTD